MDYIRTISDRQIATIKQKLPKADLNGKELYYHAIDGIEPLKYCDEVIEFGEAWYTFRRVRKDENIYDWECIGIDLIQARDVTANRYIQRTKFNYLNRFETYSQFLNNNLDWSELNLVKDEICHCLISKLYQASVTLTNHFLEDILKTGLINYFSRDKEYIIKNGEQFKTKHEKAIVEYGGINLYNAIELCAKYGLISHEREQQIKDKREQIRNGFSHADHSKIFGDIKGKFAFGKFEDISSLMVGEIEIVKNKILHGVAKADFAEFIASNYFVFAFETLEEIMQNCKKR